MAEDLFIRITIKFTNKTSDIIEKVPGCLYDAFVSYPSFCDFLSSISYFSHNVLSISVREIAKCDLTKFWYVSTKGDRKFLESWNEIELRLQRSSKVERQWETVTHATMSRLLNNE